MEKAVRPKSRRKAPLWARLCAIFGCLLMVVSGGSLIASQVLVAQVTDAVDNQDLGIGAEKKVDIKGPLNILLVGIDPRDTKTAPLSDSIIVVHVPKGMNEAYLFSIPRDLYVKIPPFDKTGFRGGDGKINSAMSYGSSIGNGQHSVPQGFNLLAKTVSGFTGINKWDAGAVINFGGFKKIVDAMGGVTMTIDQNVKSEHLAPDGSPRPRDKFCGCEHPYRGPQKQYTKGKKHLEAWEALDYVRQRYGLPKGDYDRQRHQRQFIMAMAEQALSKDVVTNPKKLTAVLQAAGKALVFDGGGHSVVDWGFALKGVSPKTMTLVKLPGGSLMTNGKYMGEAFEDSTDEFFAAVRNDTVANFLVSHPEYIDKS